jgi:hypothetical protein
MAGNALDVVLFPSGSSERWLYEDDGNSFDYRRGVSARRKFAARKEPTGLVVEIGSPEGTYRPLPRPIFLTVRSQSDASRVSAGGVALARMSADELQKAERGWSVRDGSLTIKIPDRFERVEIRIEP